MGDGHVNPRCSEHKRFQYSSTHGVSDKREKKKGREERKREGKERRKTKSRYRLVTGNSSVGGSGSER